MNFSIYFCILTVTPRKVVGGRFFIDTSNTCKRAQWQPIDAGNCRVTYSVEYFDRNYKVIGMVTGIKNDVMLNCNSSFVNATSIVIYATYKGIHGKRSDLVNFVKIPAKNGKYVFLILRKVTFKCLIW